MKGFDFIPEVLMGASLEVLPTQLSKRAQKRLRKASLGKQYSANLIVDIGNTAQSVVSLAGAAGGAGAGGATIFGSGSAIAVGSGTVIGQTCDMLHSDTYCNVTIAGQTASGQLRVQIQTSDSDTSGTFTDPTSGLPQLPGVLQSGGIIWVNSGGASNGVFAGLASGYSVASGFLAFTALQRNFRFIRANALSEATAQYAGPLVVGFTSQLKTTGSGGGFTLSPTSGVVNV